MSRCPLPAVLAALVLTSCAHSDPQVLELLQEISAKQDALAKRQEELAQKLEACPSNEPARPGRPDRDVVYRVPVGDAAGRGAALPKVTIIEWSDFQCPFCKRADATIRQVLETWPNEVRVVFKHNPLPFHAQALPAALAAEAARRQGRFWEMHDLLFENSRELGEQQIDGYARALQLNLGRFRSDVADPVLKKRIETDQAEAVRFGALGTPTFFINGRMLPGAQPFDAFKARIEAEIQRADALLDKGVPRRDLYDKLTEGGKEGV